MAVATGVRAADHIHSCRFRRAVPRAAAWRRSTRPSCRPRCPTIVGELGGLTHLSWVVTAYLLSSTVVTPLYGKFGDLHGRKIVLQVAIVVFLVGSALCGLAQNMVQLIVFRGLQGDRRRRAHRHHHRGDRRSHSAARARPLSGPVRRGVRARHHHRPAAGRLLRRPSDLAVDFLHQPSDRRAGARRDRRGAAGAAERPRRTPSIIRARRCSRSPSPPSSWSPASAATAFPGTPPSFSAMGAAAAVSLVAFVAVERARASRSWRSSLFRNRTFTLTSAVGLIVGLALFGSVTYLPIYLQLVKGESPTGSGLQLMPMMLGMLVTSVVSGRLISRFGRYRPFPIAGTILMTIGLLLMSRISKDMSVWETSADALVLGLGMGMIMQVLILAVQNSVDYEHLGVATSGATLFRAIGGALGVALFGAIFAHGLAGRAARRCCRPAPTFAGRRTRPPCRRWRLKSARLYLDAIETALQLMFRVAAAIAALGFLLTLACARCRCAAWGRRKGSAKASPCRATPPRWRSWSASSPRSLAHENRWRLYADLAERAQLDLPAPELWMLARLGERAPRSPQSLSRGSQAPLARLDAPLQASARSRHRRGGCGRESAADGRRQLRCASACWRPAARALAD